MQNPTQYSDWKEDNLSHDCFPVSLFKNAGHLGDSGWGQTLSSTDLTQETNHQLSSLLFHAPKYSCSHEINWLIIIIPQADLLTSQHSQLLGLLVSTWHFLCDCITTGKRYTWNISFIETLDPMQFAMVAAALPALFVKQISGKICDTEKKRIIEHLIASVCVKGQRISTYRLVMVMGGSDSSGHLWMTMHSGKERCLLINISGSQWFSLGAAAVTQYILLAERD